MGGLVANLDSVGTCHTPPAGCLHTEGYSKLNHGVTMKLWVEVVQVGRHDECCREGAQSDGQSNAIAISPTVATFIVVVTFQL